MYRVPDRLRAEFDRLTRKANRRIMESMKQYEKAGARVLPVELVGEDMPQMRKHWASDKSPLSRSIDQFKDGKEFGQRMKVLRQYDRPEIKAGRPTYKQFLNIQKEKISTAIETAFEIELTQSQKKEIKQGLKKMSAPELAGFWNTFSQIASSKGTKYDSEQVLAETISEKAGINIAEILEKTKKKNKK